MVSPSNPIRVGILFSGGDSPGMNPFLRSAVRLGQHRNQATVVGIRDGYQGLVRTVRRMRDRQTDKDSLLAAMNDPEACLRRPRTWPDLIVLNFDAVSGIVTRGGVIVGCGRCPEFLDHAMRRQVAGLLALLDINTLVVCGGNGSFAGAQCLVEETGQRVVGIPGTTDNDVRYSDISLGFDTAVNTIVRAARSFNDTADSHHRVMVLEVMGRICGDLARWAALASGAEAVITPEHGAMTTERMQRIAQRIAHGMQNGRRHAIVLVCEGVTTADDKQPATAALAKYLADYFTQCEEPLRRIETRCSALGHLQRGGAPTAADCVLAAKFAEAAWNETVSHQHSGVVGIRHGEIVLTPFGAAGDDSERRRREQDYQLQKDITRPPRAAARSES